MNFLNYNHDTTHLRRQPISLKEVIHKLRAALVHNDVQWGGKQHFLPLEKNIKEQNYQAIKRS